MGIHKTRIFEPLHALRSWHSFLLRCFRPSKQTTPGCLAPFVRPPDAAPVITPNKDTVFETPGAPPVHWEILHTFNPAAIVRNGKIYVLYRAEDDSGEMKIGGHASRIGLAESEDGIHFKRDPEPVLYPADDNQKSSEWEGGCEDPRVVEAEDGTYVMTYTQWNHTSVDAAIATSKDLRTWTKHGPMLGKAFGGRYLNLQYKSAGIVTKTGRWPPDRHKNQRQILDVLGGRRSPSGNVTKPDRLGAARR